MAERVCPWWLGYFLANPFRKLIENPDRMLRPFVKEGMTVIEPGSGMGYFTLPLARMVGPAGRVVAVDLQQKMLDGLRRRAGRAGLSERIEARLAGPDGLGLDDLNGAADLALAIHVVHEVPDQLAWFDQIRSALKPDGRLLVVEPKFHVKKADFEVSAAVAEEAGFTRLAEKPLRSDRSAVFAVRQE